MTTDRARGRARLLIVDDEVAQMRALCQTLADQGYETVGCNNGPDALVLLRRGRFDLLLADLAMPEMDGIALMRSALYEDEHLVGVIMTGEGTIATAVEAMRSGALDYILKPFRLSAILPVLERALQVRQLRRRNAVLEARIRKRTAELEKVNTALAEKNRQLEEFSRLKSEFLASMSHELRTPLNGILGFSTLLVDDRVGVLSARQKECISDIRQCGQHLLQLINDVLDLSKVEAGRMEVFAEEFSAQDVVASVCSTLRPLIHEKHLTLSISVDATIPLVKLDLQKVKQILFNLLSNAMKFTDSGGLIDVSLDLDGADRLSLKVRDTGVGIAATDMGRLFEVFQQLDSSASRRHEGTGLGLALTRRLVELLGGQIGVESVPGVGSTFTVTLPMSISPTTG